MAKTKKRQAPLIRQLGQLIRTDDRTQCELAAAAGVTQPTIHKINIEGSVKLETAEAVAAALGHVLTLERRR